MRLITLLCLSLFTLPLSGAAASVPAPTQTKVIVTLPPLSGLVAMLLPEIESQCLLSANADPHHFQPSPRQVAMLNEKHLLIRASHDDQGWPIRARNDQTVDLWNENAHGWLEPKLVRQTLPDLAEALSAEFPQYQKLISQRLSKALRITTELENQWSAALELFKSRGVFIQHPAWLGLLQSNHIPVWEVLESHQHGHEHGPRHLEEALQTFRLHPDAALIGSMRHSNRSLEWLQRKQNAQSVIIKLDAIGSCNTPWNSLMSENLERLSREQ